MWAYSVILRFLFCLIIDTVAFHIRFQITVSVISMEESHPFLATATEKYLCFRDWSVNFTHRHKRNRKLEDKIHVLKLYLDVKENGGKFQFCISRSSCLSPAFITNEALAMVDVRPLSHFGDKRR